MPLTFILLNLYIIKVRGPPRTRGERAETSVTLLRKSTVRPAHPGEHELRGQHHTQARRASLQLMINSSTMITSAKQPINH